MILIADSGATKTSWLLIDQGREPLPIRSQGLNPYYVDEQITVHVIRESVLPKVDPLTISHIYFYGAGCSTPKMKKIIRDPLAELFPEAAIEVEHDLLGAARATCMYQAGIACILGTGSNSCLYDGEKIVDNLPSLGFILGDEGSGADLGKRLVKAWLCRELPEDLEEKLLEDEGLEVQAVIENIYQREYPSRYLASFSTFIHQYRDHKFLQEMIRDSFTEFLVRTVKKYEGHERYAINFIGSIAYLYRDILYRVLGDQGLAEGKIIKNPMDNLVIYHTEKANYQHG